MNCVVPSTLPCHSCIILITDIMHERTRASVAVTFSIRCATGGQAHSSRFVMHPTKSVGQGSPYLTSSECLGPPNEAIRKARVRLVVQRIHRILLGIFRSPLALQDLYLDAAVSFLFHMRLV